MPVSRKEFLDIRVSVECGFTLKRTRDIIRRHSQMYRADKNTQKQLSHLSSLATWLSVHLGTKWLRVSIPL